MFSLAPNRISIGSRKISPTAITAREKRINPMKLFPRKSSASSLSPFPRLMAARGAPPRPKREESPVSTMVMGTHRPMPAMAMVPFSILPMKNRSTVL